ncbi:MAG: hypothetical protein M1325_01425 [Actinobacteria bacterium]|nr:hypothetical protein [Actinomycetota bacterium]
MNLPARHEGPHLCVGRIVSEEAVMLKGFIPYVPHRHLPDGVIQAALEDGLYAWLRSGWCRITADGRMLYWREDRGAWVPYDEELDLYYRRLPVNRITAVIGRSSRN